MKFIRTVKFAYIAVSALSAVLGLALIIRPEMGINLLCYLLGSAILLFGIIKIAGYFSKDLFRLAFQFDLALGIFISIAGLLIIIHPYTVAQIAPRIVGALWIADGSLRIQTAFDSKRFGMKNWWLLLILAVQTCLCGTLLLLDPFGGAAALVIMLGVSLVFDGAQNIFTVLYTVKSSAKKNKKIIDIE